MNDVPIIDNMAALIVRYSLAALQRDDWCGAQKTFKPIIKDAYTQAMTDQVILNRPGFVGGSHFQIGWSPYEQNNEQILP